MSQEAEQRRVFVSGCYDILHAGHVQFFREARALGSHLTVSFAGEAVLFSHKQKRSSLPDEHKAGLIGALECVDEVVMGDSLDVLGLDFITHFRRIRPHYLAVTEDDKYEETKRALCEEVGCQYVRLPKTPPSFTPISTTAILNGIRAPAAVPLRVDFGGGWLDVPRYAHEGAYIVNCAISPLVSLSHWPYERSAGLGGSGAFALLEGRDAHASEVDSLGVGWQDPAVIAETGLCVWRSGERASLDMKCSGDWFNGKLALLWSGSCHDTPAQANNVRDYGIIAAAGALARRAVMAGLQQGEGGSRIEGGGVAFNALMRSAVTTSYKAQLLEGMDDIMGGYYRDAVTGHTHVDRLNAAIEHGLRDQNGQGGGDCPGFVHPASGIDTTQCAVKYCGGGFGGYVLCLWSTRHGRDTFVKHNTQALAVEPYSK